MTEKLREKLRGKLREKDTARAGRRGVTTYSLMERLVTGKRTPADFLLEETSRIVHERAEVGASKHPDVKEEPGAIFGMRPKLWMGLLGSAMEFVTGKEIVFDTNPLVCKHPSTWCSDSAHGKCLTCGTEFTTEKPHSNSKPCAKCSAATCVCGCGRCRKCVP